MTVSHKENNKILLDKIKFMQFEVDEKVKDVFENDLTSPVEMTSELGEAYMTQAQEVLLKVNK